MTEDASRCLPELLFDWLPFAALIHDRSTVLHVNREALRRMKASSARQFAGRPITDFVHPHARDAGEARRELLEQGLHFRGVSTKLMALDGSEVHVTGCALPYRVGDTDLAVAVATSLDCPRSAYGAPYGPPAFPDGHSPHAAALETIPAALVALRGLELTYVNSACVRLMRANSADEIIGRSVLDFVEEIMREPLRERFSMGVMNAGVETDAPGKIRAVDGTVFDIITRGQMIEGRQDELRLWVIHSVDVPETDVQRGGHV